MYVVASLLYTGCTVQARGLNVHTTIPVFCVQVPWQGTLMPESRRAFVPLAESRIERVRSSRRMNVMRLAKFPSCKVVRCYWALLLSVPLLAVACFKRFAEGVRLACAAAISQTPRWPALQRFLKLRGGLRPAGPRRVGPLHTVRFRVSWGRAGRRVRTTAPPIRKRIRSSRQRTAR